MKATETKFESIVDRTIQYIVPLFQRPYTWNRANWQELWEDLTKLYEAETEKPGTHFIGSFVTMPILSGPESINQYLLIDGQQRLTTILLLLAVLRDRMQANQQEKFADEIMDTYLVNRYKSGLQYYKLLPTQVENDRSCFQAIIDQRNGDGSAHALAKAYNFFVRKLRRTQFDESKIKTLIIHHLSVVSITLDADDNPHLVFETLNARGVPLTAVDLIRNFFLMQIFPHDQDKQREIYETYWTPMQHALEDDLTEFVRHYLMKDGGFIRKDEIYNELRARVNRQDDVLAYLKTLVRYSHHYQKLLYPVHEPQPQIQSMLKRLKRLDFTVMYPFLLNCYEDYVQQQLSSHGFVEVLQILENFVLRRFVCTIPTHGLNKIFPALYNQAINHDDFLAGIKQNLQARDYPPDETFRRNLTQGSLYGRNRQPRAKLILEQIEKSYQHKEAIIFDNLTIEHVMPQTLTPEWIESLGENYEEQHDLWLHNLGNLTLTGFNSELSNADFQTKKAELAQSHLEINKYFQPIEHWTEVEIEARANHLADLMLQIWPYFGDEERTPLPSTVTSTKPERIHVLGQTIEVRTWRDVIEQTLICIAELEPEQFESLVGTFPRFVSYDKTSFRDFRELPNGAFVYVGLSAQQIYQFCLRVKDELMLTTDDWRIELKHNNQPSA